MPPGFAGSMSVAGTSRNLYFTGRCDSTPSGSLPVHAIVIDGVVLTGCWRLGRGVLIVVEGATVNDVNERLTGAERAPSLSTARTTNVWYSLEGTIWPAGGNGLSRGSRDGYRRVTSLEVVLTHAVSPPAGGSFAYSNRVTTPSASEPNQLRRTEYSTESLGAGAAERSTCGMRFSTKKSSPDLPQPASAARTARPAAKAVTADRKGRFMMRFSLRAETWTIAPPVMGRPSSTPGPRRSRSVRWSD